MNISTNRKERIVHKFLCLGKNEHFVALLNCMVENNCMDRYEESGSCLANDSQALNTEEREQLISDYFAGKANAPGGEY